jgi:hypothetical protein
MMAGGIGNLFGGGRSASETAAQQAARGGHPGVNAYLANLPAYLEAQTIRKTM